MLAPYRMADVAPGQFRPWPRCVSMSVIPLKADKKASIVDVG